MKKTYSDELALYRLEKAKNELTVARVAVKLSNYENSVGRSYYAIFTAMRALLATKNLDSKSHKGVITLFSLHFIKEKIFPKGFHKIITEAKLIREKADYGDFVNVTREIAESHLSNAEVFVSRIEEVLKKRLKSGER